jgi:hypothetical protein
MESQFEVDLTDGGKEESQFSRDRGAVLETCDHGPLTVEPGRLGVAGSPQRLRPLPLG